MHDGELAHLELLAEIDSLVTELREWSAHAPVWGPARRSAALVSRLTARADALRLRLEAPLVVATLGGTGTGKSTLVNALVGAEVVRAGRERPTTRRPTFVGRTDLTPEQLGIDSNTVDVVSRDLPALRDLVLIDCPDPDTTEDAESRGTNLARLREILPHCDVLLVTTTQQKYRSARVLDELAAAAPGARLVFVVTHADTDADVRDDWRGVLAKDYEPGEIFFVDSLAALADAEGGIAPRGEFARLVDLLTRQLAGAAGNRIRRANFLDLTHETLAACRMRIDAARPALGAVEAALVEQRGRLAAKLAGRMRDELLSSRRQWENRLLAEVTSRWGYSPFSLLLRAYQGIGGLISGAVLMRARTPAQLALWGAVAGGQAIARQQGKKRADDAVRRAAAWDWCAGDLRTASIILDGYAAEAELTTHHESSDRLAREAVVAGESFAARASSDLQQTVRQLASRHVGWFTRARYELALLAMLGVLLYRLGRNYFYDSWLAPEPVPVFGIDFLVASGLWLVLWCGLLLWAYTSRLRRGLKSAVNELAEKWTTPAAMSGLFADYDDQCQTAKRFGQQLERLEARVAALRTKVAEPTERLGHKIG